MEVQLQKMKAVQWTILIVMLVSAAAYFTKPSDEECKLEGRKAAKEYILEDNPGSRFALVDRFAERASENFVTVEDKFLYKTILFKDKQIGWAAFGMLNIKMK